MNAGMIARLVSALLLASLIAVTSPTVSAQTPDTFNGRVARALPATGYTFTTHNASTWSVDLNRQNTGRTKVILSTGTTVLVVFVVMAKRANIQKTPQFLEELAKANNDYDYVKIGLDKDGDFFVRIDVNSRLADAVEVKAAIDQVANVANELYPKVSAWAKR